MRVLLVILTLFWYSFASAQKPVPLPHGMVFGIKPDTSSAIAVARLDSMMGHKVRISTTLRGKVVKVVKQQGGWFLLEVGKSKTIEAHFKDFNVELPFELAGRTVLAQGVAAKQFKADPYQHYAGDSVKAKPTTTKPKRKLTIDFEVKGLMVYQ